VTSHLQVGKRLARLPDLKLPESFVDRNLEFTAQFLQLIIRISSLIGNSALIPLYIAYQQ
jgi:hypothetical protein